MIAIELCPNRRGQELTRVGRPPERDLRTQGPLFEAFRLYGIIVGAVLGFGVGVGVLVLVGHWLDSRWSTRPWLTVTGAILGLAIGLYQLVLIVRQVGRRG